MMEMSMHTLTDHSQDDVLAQAVRRADAIVAKGIQELEAKRWKLVAEGLKAMRVSISNALMNLD